MEGRKDDADRVRLELFPSVAIFAISRVLTKGAIKYEKTSIGELWNAVQPTAIDLFTAGVFAVGITKDSYGSLTLHTRNVSGKIEGTTNGKTLTKFDSWQRLERAIREHGLETQLRSEEDGLERSGLPRAKLTNSYEEAVQFVKQSGTFGSITTIKRDGSEAFYATVATSASATLVTTLKGLNGRLPISVLLPAPGERNWEKGMKWSRVYGAALRHLFAWFAGRGPTAKSFLFGDLDDEWKFSHLWHAGCCIVFLISYEEWQIGEDDRPIQAAPKTVPRDELLEKALRRGLSSPPPVPARPGGLIDGSDGGAQ